MARILLIEDEAGMVLTLTDRLESEGYQVTSETDGLAGFERASKEEFDLILLDVMLPKTSGFDVLRDLRKEGNEIPVLMLTAKNETIDKVLGLKLGADDYLAKPFEMMELLARVEALLRRSVPTGSNGRRSSGKYSFEEVTIDFGKAEVQKGDSPIDLSAMEFKLLQYLIENEGNVHSRDELLDAVWGYDAMPTTRTVDVHISWLRQKLEVNPKRPRHIQTVHGLGYKFVP